MKLSELIQQPRFETAGQEAVLNIVVTGSWLMSEMASSMAPFGVTPAQYNVLRILAGSAPDRLTCSDIGGRLLDRTPDVTRLLNRLEKARLISRTRSRTDRRVVRVGLTDQGRELLQKMDPVVNELNRRLSRHLSDDELAQLSDLLERLRTDQTA